MRVVVKPAPRMQLDGGTKGVVSGAWALGSSLGLENVVVGPLDAILYDCRQLFSAMQGCVEGGKWAIPLEMGGSSFRYTSSERNEKYRALTA